MRLAILAAGFCAAALQAQAAPPPASAFGRVPAVVDAEISPDGRRVAILGGASDRRFISIATIDEPGLPRLDLGDVETVNLRWVGDAYVVATVAYWDRQSSMIAHRVERHITVTPKAQAIARFLDTRLSGWYVTGQPILGVTASGPPRVLVLDLSEVDNFGVMRALWSVDPATGKGKLVERGDRDTRTFSVDLAGEPRVRIDTGRYAILGRAKGKGQWAPIVTQEEAKGGMQYLGYADAEDAIYVVHGGKLVRRRLADRAAEPVSEAGPSLGLVWDEHRGALVGVSMGAERPTLKWSDPELEQAHGVLTRAFRGQKVDLMGWSRDRARLIARVDAPSAAPVWHLYDRTRKEISPLGEEYPELKGVALGTTRWLTYKAADGLEIPAYLTLPPGAKPGGKAPLIVLPHGGPAFRDHFGFDYMAQFLATRGYAVLQPQYRGSSGFGEAFQKAGYGEWSGKMQTDLLDGIKAVAADGDIDPTRVCIVGSSFGGYAALAGVALHPDAYRCAASIAGIADLNQLIAEEGRLYGLASESMDDLRTMLGAVARDKLQAGSPGHLVARIKAPVLLIHGDQDTIVRVEQSRRMADALKAAGKPHELIILEGENHYLTKSAHRIRTLEALEQFLAKNLPVS